MSVQNECTFNREERLKISSDVRSEDVEMRTIYRYVLHLLLKLVLRLSKIIKSWSCDIFTYYTVLHNPINNSSMLPVSAYLQAIIISVHYLELTKPHTVVHIQR